MWQRFRQLPLLQRVRIASFHVHVSFPVQGPHPIALFSFLPIFLCPSSKKAQLQSAARVLQEVQNLQQELAKKDEEIQTFKLEGTLRQWLFGHTNKLNTY